MISRNDSSLLLDSYVNLIVGCIELIFFMYSSSFSFFSFGDVDINASSFLELLCCSQHMLLCIG